MSKIALITDSSCDLDRSYIEKHSINLLPLRIIYKDKEYLDRLEITSEEFLSNLDKEIPKTSLPDLDYANKVIEKLIADGYTQCIVTTLSSAISGTFNSLRLLCEHYDNIDFYFFDSKTLGFPHGAMNIKIAELIENNVPFEDIISQLENIRVKTHGFLTCATLEHLKKGGRIGAIAGSIAEVLNIKPIISSNEDGILYTHSKYRGRKQSISKLKEYALKYLQQGKCRIWILNGNSNEDADKLFNLLKDHDNLSQISLENMGASVLVHTGPGALGVCIFQEN